METLPAVAVSVADCAELTAATVAGNPMLVALAGTVTVAGTVTEVLLLERLTTNPPAPAAALRVTVQASAPAPVIDPLAHVSALNATAWLSCNENVCETLPAVAVSVAV
jgi:hypothetical protein